ncbi:MAG: hypothetical protein VB067_14820 [Christensenellaceae bacterium]|nr:hypothetical protein [Christensenellaceae bacterium]MEA5070263.1 hypothetical protein [Christensenellaceae bacterium]
MEIMLEGLRFIEYHSDSVSRPTGAYISVTTKRVMVGKTVRESLGSRARLLATPDGTRIAIGASLDEVNGFRIRKNGEVSASKFIQALSNAGIAFPARYDMALGDDGIWISGVVKLLNVQPMPDTAAKKPRKRGLSGMMPKGGSTT